MKLQRPLNLLVSSGAVPCARLCFIDSAALRASAGGTLWSDAPAARPPLAATAHSPAASISPRPIRWAERVGSPCLTRSFDRARTAHIITAPLRRRRELTMWAESTRLLGCRSAEDVTVDGRGLTSPTSDGRGLTCCREDCGREKSDVVRRGEDDV